MQQVLGLARCVPVGRSGSSNLGTVSLNRPRNYKFDAIAVAVAVAALFAIASHDRASR